MPRTIHPRLRSVIYQNAERFDAPRLHDMLKKAIDAGQFMEAKPPIPPGTKAPSERRIRDLIRDARSKPPEERLRRTEVFWPESFHGELGILPWEASMSFFELYLEIGFRRPFYPLVYWFWKVTELVEKERPLGDPRTPREIRHNLAADLATWEVMPVPDNMRRRLEMYMLWRPWRSPELMQRYEELTPDDQRYPIDGQDEAIIKRDDFFEIYELREGAWPLGTRETIEKAVAQAKEFMEGEQQS